MSEARRQWIVVAGIVAVLLLLLGVGWTVRDRFLPPEVGTRAPDFAVRDMQGRPVSLSDLRGDVVLLNIWATWCGPCREEMPSMQRLHEQLGDEGLRIVAVSIDGAGSGAERAGDVAAFARQFGLTFPIWLNPSGDIQRTYRTTGVPETFLIGRDGVIRKKVIGATEWDSPEKVELIRRLLRE